jgi:hypothetical protein
MFSHNEKYAGLLLVVGGIIYLWSDSVGVHYDSTVLINVGVALLGVLMLAGAYFLQIAFKSTLFTILVVLAAIGTIGVGVIPFGGTAYYAFAYLGYVFFGLSAIMSYKFVKSPLNYISILLGVLSLLGLLLWVSGVDLGSGVKASPIVIDYLILPWLVAFGANIIREETDSSAKA